MAEQVTGDDDYGFNSELALVNAVTPLSHFFSDFDNSPIIYPPPRFSVPDGWIVQKVPRYTGDRVDRYYIEPETGRKFRSRNEVMRYLNNEDIQTTGTRPLKVDYTNKSCACKKIVFSGGKMLDFNEDEAKDNQYQLVNVTTTSNRSRSSLNLPDGWTVEYVPRRSSDHIDRYYYEPGTGKKFRSLSDIRKHLEELEENSPLSVILENLKENNLPLSKAFKLSTSKKNRDSYNSRKKSVSKKEQVWSLNKRPTKINWVMSSSGGESWNAFVDDSLVPDCLQQQWGRRFMFDINNNNHNASVSG